MPSRRKFLAFVAATIALWPFRDLSLGELTSDPLRIFPDEFVANMESDAYYSRWATTNKHDDLPKWIAYRDAVIARQQLVPPVMQTQYGKALVAAGKMHMSISRLIV